MNWFRLIALLLPLLLEARAGEPFAYKSGCDTIEGLGRDIFKWLEPIEKFVTSPQPISIDTSSKPFVRLLVYKDGPGMVRAVCVSQGFVDLINHLSHAKAIDKKRRGYFQRYLQLIESAGDSIPPLPDCENPAFWTDSLLNEQLSNFNSIMGIVVGINLAHHYLGFYEKYRAVLDDSEGDPAPLNDILTPLEWELSYRRGLNNAMLASCMTEGFLPLCDGLNAMKHRPEWVSYFFPKGTSVSAMRKDMVKLQRKFLSD